MWPVAAHTQADDPAAAAASARGSITTVALDADENPLLASADTGEVTDTASLVKLLVVARLLEQDAAGALTPRPRPDGRRGGGVRDAAMRALWDRYDGPQLVTDVAAELGLAGTAPPAVAGQWGEATTTAVDVATFLAALGDTLDDPDGGTMLGWMRSTTATSADGFAQRFGLLCGAGEPIAAKQGWMCCIDNRRQLHSARVLADGRVVVLLGQFPVSTGWGGRPQRSPPRPRLSSRHRLTEEPPGGALCRACRGDGHRTAPVGPNPSVRVSGPLEPPLWRTW